MSGKMSVGVRSAATDDHQQECHDDERVGRLRAIRTRAFIAVGTQVSIADEALRSAIRTFLFDLFRLIYPNPGA